MVTVVIVDPADTIHAVTKAICRRLLSSADALKMLPSTRSEMEAVVADTTPRYFKYVALGHLDSHGFERTEVELRLGFDNLDEVTRVEDCEGARYVVQRLHLRLDLSQSSYSVEAAGQHVEHMRVVVAAAAEIESAYAGRDLYLLLATPEEAREQDEQRRRSALSHFIATEVSGLRRGQSCQVLCDVAARLPSLPSASTTPQSFLGVETRDRGKPNRTYDVSVSHDAVTVTRTS